MSVLETISASFSILELNLPGHDPVPVGVLLLDPEKDVLHVRLRQDWEKIAPEEADVLADVEADLRQKAKEKPGSELLIDLEDSLSNVLTIGDRRQVIVENADRALARIYRNHVHPRVIEFETHLPRYSLEAAAGKFLDNQEIEPTGWDEVPSSLKLKPTAEMFVGRIAGESMEPRIPDGSLCVFRRGVVGSKNGRLLLVELLGRGANDRYTVKEYHSKKLHGEDGEWRNERITLRSLNPASPTWDLDPDEADNLRVIAEFICVLE